MKTILIPVFNERISSRLDCTEYFLLIKIKDKIIQNRETIKIITKNQLEKLNVILSMKPDTVICNGLTEFFENGFLKNNIELISSVYGLVEERLNEYLDGKLISKTFENITSNV